MDWPSVLVFLLLLVALAALLAALLWVWSQTNARLTDIGERIAATGKLQEGSLQSFGQIEKDLGRLSEASRHMEEVGKEIAGLDPTLRDDVGQIAGDLVTQPRRLPPVP